MVKKAMKWPEDFVGKVIQGDCLEVMRFIPDGSIDLIVTDPPYGFGRFEGDEKNFLEVLGPSFQEWPRILKARGAAFVFMSTGEVVNLANKIPLRFKRLLWMYKPADMTFPLDGWLLKSEAILWFQGKNGCDLEDRRPYHHDVYIHTKTGKEGVEGHPTVKPLEVVRDLVYRCPKYGIMPDPFIGSGTTAVAAEQTGRKWIGIEINPEYCEIARGRVEKERSQLKMF